jgi:hypothetical protein
MAGHVRIDCRKFRREKVIGMSEEAALRTRRMNLCAAAGDGLEIQCVAGAIGHEIVRR